MRLRGLFWFVVPWLVLALWVGWAETAGNTVGPNQCTMTWTQAPTNANGSPLTDLSGWRIFVYTMPGQIGATATATVPAAGPAPVGVLNLTFDCRGLTLSEGQKYATVKAVDLGLLESAPAVESPFVWNAVAPATPGGFAVQ
jgi:hypothetical protein